MGKLNELFSILIIIIILFSCGDAPVDNVPVNYSDFAEASFLQVTAPGAYVFTDDDSWNSFCDEYWSGNIPRPEVDFDYAMVIGIFWGWDGGCYRWVNCVQGVYIRQDVIDVHIAPLPDLGDCDMVIWPLQVITMDKYEMPVEFHGYVPGSFE